MKSPRLILAILVVARAVVSACPAADVEEMVFLQFPSGDVRDVVSAYNRLTGLKVVPDDMVQGTINVALVRQIPKLKAIAFIEQSLFANGYSMVQIDEGTVRVVGIGKEPRDEGIPLVSKAEDIPANERLISFAIKLQFRQPEEIIPVLLQQTGASQALGNIFAADPAARAVIVTERPRIIRNLIELIKEIDVPKRK